MASVSAFLANSGFQSSIELVQNDFHFPLVNQWLDKAHAAIMKQRDIEIVGVPAQKGY